MKATKIIAAATLLFAQLVCHDASAHPAADVRVYRETTPTATVYHYRVFNFRHAQAIVAFHVGFDGKNRLPQLSASPVGWSSQTAPRVDFGTLIPEAGATSPTGWHASVVLTEETPLFDIRWESLTPTSPVAPQLRRRGFSVTVPAPDSAYEMGNWTVIFSDSVEVSDRLVTDTNPAQPDPDEQEPPPPPPPPPPPDTEPPVLRIVLTPTVLWPPNGKLIDVNASIEVRDNEDQRPRVQLISVTCNLKLRGDEIVDTAYGTDDRAFRLRARTAGKEKAGRVYTVTYAATDSSGNSTLAEATVKVPHDQRDSE